MRPELVAHLEDLVDRRDARAFAIASFYDGPRHKPEAAVAAYEEFLRQYPRSPRAVEARRRLDALKAAAPSSAGKEED
jgi:outer membrane protein assembly factor BamD (BamD/ComL family)